MGVELTLQAIPEGWDLLRRARIDAAFAEYFPFIHSYASLESLDGRPNRDNPNALEFFQSVKVLVQADPSLIDRYAYLGSRRFDQIVYLLSEARRERATFRDFEDSSLINKAIWGTERLHPEVTAGQGQPLGFVRTKDVWEISEYLQTITRDVLHAYYDPPKMVQACVYKIHTNDAEQNFDVIWQEFTKIRAIYGAAAEHSESMITCID